MKKLFWSLKSIPELAGLPPLLRWRAWVGCSHKTFRHWRTWRAFAVAIVPVTLWAVLMAFSYLWLPQIVDSERDIYFAVWLPAGIFYLLSLPGIIWLSHAQAEVIRPYLREYLLHGSTKTSDTTS